MLEKCKGDVNLAVSKLLDAEEEENEHGASGTKEQNTSGGMAKIPLRNTRQKERKRQNKLPCSRPTRINRVGRTRKKGMLHRLVGPSRAG